MISRCIFAAIALILMSAVLSQAAIVNLDLQTDEAAHTWVLQAIVSQGNNAGLCSLVVDLTGIDTAQMVAPSWYDANLGLTRGFTLSGTALSDSLYEALASQNVLSGPAAMIYGIGQVNGSAGGVDWGVPVRLYEGTYSTGVPALDGPVLANLFVAPGSVQVFSATIELGDSTLPPGPPDDDGEPIPAVPVPASLVLGLLGLGSVWSMARRRRSA